MRFLVFGSTGMAGHMVSLYLTEQGHEVDGTARHDASFLVERGVHVISLDVTDSDAVKQILFQGDYDIVVNCVGLLNKACDERPDLAVYLNSYFPHLLEAVTCGMHTRVFHLSTDCVFAGNDGPYSEGSFPDGTTFYDRTKALGEIRNDKDLTLRQSIVGPDPDPEGIGLFNWFMRQEGEVCGYAGAIWTGLTTLELARAIESCAESAARGLVNMVPKGVISKYDLLCMFKNQFQCRVTNVLFSPVPRIDKRLVKTNTSIPFEPKSYACQIVELRNWIIAHADLYPHYDMGGSI